MSDATMTRDAVIARAQRVLTGFEALFADEYARGELELARRTEFITRQNQLTQQLLLGGEQGLEAIRELLAIVVESEKG